VKAIIAGMLLAFAIVGSGCKLLQRNTGTAYVTVGAVLEAADAAMIQWANYVVAEEDRIATLSPGDRIGARSDLLRREGKVQMAFEKYKKAMLAAKIALKSALQNPQAAEAPTSVVHALIELQTATAQ